MKVIKFNVAKEFSDIPFGRYKEDAESCGEAFRDDYLIPLIVKNPKTIIELDFTEVKSGVSSGFIEEVFGGMVRLGFDKYFLKNGIKIIERFNHIAPTMLESIDYAEQPFPILELPSDAHVVIPWLSRHDTYQYALDAGCRDFDYDQYLEYIGLSKTPLPKVSEETYMLIKNLFGVLYEFECTLPTTREEMFKTLNMEFTPPTEEEAKEILDKVTKEQEPMLNRIKASQPTDCI